jgi:hypothetical protein
MDSLVFCSERASFAHSALAILAIYVQIALPRSGDEIRRGLGAI